MRSTAWSILTKPPLPGAPPATVAYAALHPARGIALLDTSPAPVPDAIARLRVGLSGIPFSAIYDGHLPIIYRQISAADLATLAADLDKAFAAEPPISLTAPPGADPATWVGLAHRVLGADLAPTPPPPLKPAVPVTQPRATPVPPRPPKLPIAPRRRAVAQAGAATTAILMLGGGLYAWQLGFDPTAPSPALPPPAILATPAAVAEPTEPPPELAPLSPSEAPPILSQPDPPKPPEVAPVAPKLPAASEGSIQEAPTPAPSVSNATLIKRGDEMMGRHDILAARAYYERAANAGDGVAAQLLGRTFDPAYLKASERGFADLVRAQTWYSKAGMLGVPLNMPDTDFERRFRAAVQRAN